MTYRGRVEGGSIILEQPATLPEGAVVEVRLLNDSLPEGQSLERSSLAERLKDVVAKARGLPPDAAMNHDHYLYGLPKR